MARALDIAELSSRLSQAPDSGALKPIGIRAVTIGPKALDELPSLVASLVPDQAPRRIAVLTDTTPKRRGSAELLPLVEQSLAEIAEVQLVAVHGEHGRVHADEETLAKVAQAVAGAIGLVTVGSGTLADIGKATASRLKGLPHVVVQTATSVNGFADDQSVLLVKGVKRTTPTRWPDGLVVDTDVIVAAPAKLNLAGVGDLAAMFTAPADWRLAFLLGMADTYSPTAVELVRRHGPAVLAAAPGLARGDAEAASTIAYVLTLSGISMGVAGTTAPASGMEHTVSHLIEMAMNRRGQEAAYHGAQVGVSTLVAAVLWERVRAFLDAGSRPALAFPSTEAMESKVLGAFSPLDPSGEMGEECWRLYSKKLARWSANRDRLESIDWGGLMGDVQVLLLDPADLARSLSSAGAPLRFSDLDPPVDTDLVGWALANCHLMRDRFTIADLAFFFGLWESDGVESVLASAARVGAGL